jgi:3-methylfumaryl-CoA hydratase
MTSERFAEWIGRTETSRDRIAARPAAAMAATVNRSTLPSLDDTPLPPLWHWLYFLETPLTNTLARDGHVERGGFLPPIELPRRMWAGSRIRFHRPLRIGEHAERVSSITRIDEKQGRSGQLAIVTVEHHIRGESGPAITDEHDIVYREEPRPDAPPPPGKAPPTDAAWSVARSADPVLLFRYSALTFNSHRIHYDQPYATGVEGYPGLVVHGPLVATLLAEECATRYPDRTIATLHVRALRPLFHDTTFHLCGRPASDGTTVDLWCVDADGAMTMEVTATLAE